MELQRFRAMIDFDSDLFKLSSREPSDGPQRTALVPPRFERRRPDEAWEACARNKRCVLENAALQRAFASSSRGGRGREPDIFDSTAAMQRGSSNVQDAHRLQRNGKNHCPK